jgi:hypothetical protein
MTAILRTIGWGLFCTSSWTWCIGMWLPVIVIYRWGWPGFWAFAISNIIGCTLMGYVVGSRSRSEQLVKDHRGAMRWFSIFTIAFQLFWVSAVFGQMGWFFGLPNPAAMLLAPLVVLLLGGLATRMSLDRWLIFALCAFLFAVGIFVTVGTGSFEQISGTGERAEIELWGTVPIIFLGFLLSPYLDLTFHRARRETPSPHSFAVFGGTFLIVLLLVAACYGIINPTLHTPATSATLVALISLFWLMQVIFTIGAHLRELNTTNAPSPNRWGSTRRLLCVAVLAMPITWLAMSMHDDVPNDWHWLLEDHYLRFLGFYGLLVPAWVLAFMGPRRPATRSTGAFVALAIAIAISMPMADQGMIRTASWWILTAVVIVVMTAMLLPRGDPRPAD